jgi:hypothetical protein
MTLGCGVLFKKRCILFKSPSLGLWCLTKYIESITRLCSVVDFSGSLAPLILILGPRLPPPSSPSSFFPSSSSSFSLSSSSPFSPFSSSSFSPSSSSSLSLSSSSSCSLRRRHPPRLVVVGFVHSPVVVLSGGRVVRYRVVAVVALWGASLRRSYCRGCGWVVVVVVGLSGWWLCCCCGGCTVVVVVAPSSWCHGPRYTCVGLGCSSFHRDGTPSSLCHPRLGFCCHSPRREDFPTPGLNPRVVV